MTHLVRWLSTVAIIALCLAATFVFAQAQQQQARPAGQPAGPAPQAAAPSRAGGAEGRPATADELSKDTCWQKTPCLENHRPPVAFREDWMDATPGKAVDYKDTNLDAHLQNKNLTMVRYGIGAKDVLYDRHVSPKDDPGYIWLGACADGPCVITIKDKNDYLDLSNAMSKVVWRTKQGGFRELRLVLKLADGNFLISDRYAGPAEDWNISEILISDVRWRKLVIQPPTRIYEDNWVDKPNLSSVDEIGFTDLMVGGPSFFGGTSRVDWIEVHANKVKRPTGTNNN